MSNEGDKAWPNGLGYAGDEAGSLSAHTREQEQLCDCIVVVEDCSGRAQGIRGSKRSRRPPPVIGGGPAGLSAALVLGRACR